MFSTFKWVEPDKTVVFPYHKIHPKSEIFGHKREANNKKSWKTISNTLSINYIHYQHPNDRQLHDFGKN